MKSFYVIILLFITVCSSSKIVSKTSSSNSKSKVTNHGSSSEKTTISPAIIAIEIVDPNENVTSSKNSKRTIDGSLGYGYNNFASGSSKPRYEVYKYSQHDIPPYSGNAHNLYSESSADNSINIQKSVQYTLPSTTHYENSNVLQPGTTLYTSLSGKGQTSGLSSSLPQTLNAGEVNTPVPVIVLRIYPNQLKDSTIQANLPENHPFAKSINSINIQSLLKHYIKALKHPELINQYPENHNSYETQTNVVAKLPQVYGPPQEHIPSPAAVGLSQYYSTQNVQHSYQNFGEYQNDNVQTYHDQYQQQQQQPQQLQYYQQQTYAQDNTQGTTDTGNTYGYPQIQEQPQQHQQQQQQQQYYYVPQNYVTKSPETDYIQNQQEYYTNPDQGHAQQQYQTVLPNFQPFYVNTNGQYQPAYYEPSQTDLNQRQYDAKSQELLTHENYPSDKHTKVYFRSTSGKIKSSAADAEQSPTKEVKTIKIHVPDNIQKVEVQETNRPYHVYETNNKKMKNNENKDQQQESKFYYVQPNTESAYYTKGESQNPNNNNNYNNVDNLSYEQMIKYLATRGVAGYYSPNQNNGGSDSGGGASELEIAKNNIIKQYEEAAFPTTTQTIIRKRTKNKKKTYS